MNTVPDTKELLDLASKLGPEDFAARFPHLFLVFYETVETVGVSAFATQVISKDAARARPMSQIRAVPLVKAPNNPYSDRISLGRARNCDVVLRNPSVSKLHAHIRKEPNGTWVVIDANSHNGTTIEGNRVAAGQPIPIKIGEPITFGGMLVRIVTATIVHQALLGRPPWAHR
jgi:hypothetical protein